MLGKLFSLGTGGSCPDSHGSSAAYDGHSGQPTSRGSVQEDMHTRNLLFPDVNVLDRHRNDQLFPLTAISDVPLALTGSNHFDYRADFALDIDHVRVLIMQDFLGSSAPLLLFDSHPPPPPPSLPEATAQPTSPSDARVPPTSPRKSSVGSVRTPLQPDSPLPRQGAFDRRASHGRSQAHPETDFQRTLREYREEIASFSSCIFGCSELMAYKGTSSKLHIIPGGFVAPYRAAARFPQSHSSENVSPLYPHPPGTASPSASSARHYDRQRVLITRLFPVTLPAEDLEPNQPVPSHARASDDATGFPFPPPDDNVSGKKKPALKQRKTPMYAIALVVTLPPAPSHLMPATSRSSFRSPGSLSEHDSFPSSYGSARRTLWSGVGSANDLRDSPFSADPDDRMDVLTQHWDIVVRTLTLLQSRVTTTLSGLLKRVAAASSEVRTSSASVRKGPADDAVKPAKSTSRYIVLQEKCLIHDRSTRQAIDSARLRIVAGLSVARVVTGQGRWGIWRDEVGSMARVMAKRDRGHFFATALTGFLATHTDWLQALSPVAYRKRHVQQQRAKVVEEDLPVTTRTVIIADDRIMARRLIFLLSAFLPMNQQRPQRRPHRPSTSASLVGMSANSPPSAVVTSNPRSESLRRKLNRRTVPRRSSHARAASQGNRSPGVPAQLAHLSMDDGTGKRDSECGEKRLSTLSMLSSDANRKSSAATATIPPEATVPHFSTQHQAPGTHSVRPRSTGSVAADDLKRSLQRGESSGNFSVASNDSKAQSSKWGNVISGFWGVKPRESSETVHSQHSAEDSARPPAKSATVKPSKLEDMVQEVSAMKATPTPIERRIVADTESEVRDRAAPQGPQIEPRLPGFPGFSNVSDPASAFASPVKTSINEEDGVIDVDVPFPDWITSFETAVSSASSSGYLSAPGFGTGIDSFEHMARTGLDGESPLNVAGWLQRYHPDFALQAVPPQDGLLATIRESLKAEPSSTSVSNSASTNDPTADRWVDVSTVLVIDATANTAKRIRYRRLVRPKPVTDRFGFAGAGNGSVGAPPTTPYVMACEASIEEEFVEEAVAATDAILAEAVDKVIALGGEPATLQASASSAVGSQSKESSEGGDGHRPPAEDIFSSQGGTSQSSSQPPLLLEVPREQCKSVILSALQTVIRMTIEAVEREGQESRADGGRDHNAVITRGEGESHLMEAVRVWLLGIDTGD